MPAERHSAIFRSIITNRDAFFRYLRLLLSELGICASSGSACTSGSLEPSHVLRAMGVPFTCAHGSIRFSLSRYTTDAEIDTVVKVINGALG